jgi:hypothetical protein
MSFFFVYEKLYTPYIKMYICLRGNKYAFTAADEDGAGEGCVRGPVRAGRHAATAGPQRSRPQPATPLPPQPFPRHTGQFFNTLLQLALNGPAPNQLLLSLLNHSLATQVSLYIPAGTQQSRSQPATPLPPQPFPRHTGQFFLCSFSFDLLIDW